jgi:translation initiation factor IF-2
MELSACRAAPASAVVVEAQVDKGLGPVATVIVREGELRVGNPIVVGTKSGKVCSRF